MSVDHIQGETFHGRKGGIENAFRYSVDYLMLDAEADVRGPALFSRNRANLTSLRDRDHGGAPGVGRGAAWVRTILAERGIDLPGPVLLLAQPRVLGHVFNPVSFWLCHDRDDKLCLVISEVTNTFGERHSYICCKDDLTEITPDDTIEADKIFYVSPFQKIEGGYRFNFDIRADRIAIRIDYSTGNAGLLATLSGMRAPLTNRSILAACLRRPLGSRRVLGLIHWQAVKLWWKGARYRVRPAPPEAEVSR
ncbi:MAG: DUF1365 domain-containing protein [Pseudomonadota bacterium]